MIRKIARCDASANNASTDCGCTEQNTKRGGGAIAKKLVAEHARGGARKFLVGERFLSRIGVAIQPIQQLRTLGSDDSGLHEMDMRIDEARRDQAIAVVGNDGIRRQIRFQRVVAAGGDDLAVVNDDKPVGLMPERFRCAGEKRIVGAPDERSAQSGRRVFRAELRSSRGLFEHERRAHGGCGRNNDTVHMR